MMSSGLLIKAFPARRLEQLGAERYDGFLASLGFERRSREIPEAVGTPGHRVAVPFGDRQTEEYAVNLAWFTEHGWGQPECTEETYEKCVTDWLANASTASSDTIRVAVDVSSMSRHRMAAVVEHLMTRPLESRLEVDFLYAPAEFDEPSEEEEPPVLDVAPVSGFFAGWWSALDLPLRVIIGVGYEFERASSAINALEPLETQVYVPEGKDDRYMAEVIKANKGLMETEGVMPETISYRVPDPFSCLRRLESSLGRLKSERRVALVPLGPKIFSICAMLIAGLYPESSQVIRVSAGDRQEAINRRSDQTVCGLTVTLEAGSR
jgi:phage tail protein X